MLAQRFLAAVALCVGLGYAGLSIWTYQHASGGTMFNEPNGTVTDVLPKGPEQRAGIVVGDRLDLAHMSQASHYYVIGGVLPPAGTIENLLVIHHGTERAVTVAAAAVPSDIVSPWKRAVAAMLVLLAGILLIWRPQRATWAFMAYALITTVGLSNQYLRYPLAEGVWFLRSFLGPLDVVALLYMAIWFLSNEQRRWHRPLAGAVLTGALAYAILNMVSTVGGLQGKPLHLPAALQYWEPALAILTLFVLVEAAVTGRRAHRQKITWVVAALSFAVVFYDVVPFFYSLRASVDNNYSITFYIVYALNSISPLLVGATLLYAMTQYRVVDLRFAVSRALVYAATTALMISFFALIEWGAGRIFEGTRVAFYAGLLAAVLIGFAVNSMHRKADEVIDAIFFRRERNAALRLRHIAASLLHADEEGTIAALLVDEPVRALDLTSAALFFATHDGERYERVRAIGWNAMNLPCIERSDVLVPQMRAISAPLSVDDLHWQFEHLPPGEARPVIGVPIQAHGDLCGMLFYGAHSDGATLNSDERELLMLLARNAAAAYDHIDAARARAEIAGLRLQLNLAR